MGFKNKFFELKKEWKFFWKTVLSRRKPRLLRSGAAKSGTLSGLSFRRQQLNLRLEEIERETERLARENNKKVTKKLVKLHDEGQKISEKIQEVTEKISEFRDRGDRISV